MSIKKYLTTKNVLILLVVSVMLGSIVMMGLNSQDKANGLSEVYITENDVTVYKENKKDIITTLQKGDKVTMFNATVEYTSIKINNTVGFVETRFVDLSTANISEETKIHLWSSMQELGLINKVPTYDGASKADVNNSEALLYNWHVKIMNKLLGKDGKTLPTEPKTPVVDEPTPPIVEEPVDVEEPTPTPPVVEPTPVEPVSKYTDTFKYIYLTEENKQKPFEITTRTYTVVNDSVKAYDSPSTSAKVNAIYNAGDEVKQSSENFKYVKNHYATKNSAIEWVVVQEMTNSGWVYSYIKRSDLVSNYTIYVSPSAKNWKYDHSSANVSAEAMFSGKLIAPMYDSADYVTNPSTMHDPVYNTLPAGTSIAPTGVSNSSIQKPKAGTGASSLKYIPSTGTAAGDGWVAPSLNNKKYNADRFEFTMDFEAIGMYWNPTQHMGSIFITGDGSRLDVMAVNQEVTKARFVLTNVNTKESYRSKEMLKVVLPYFFKNNTATEVNQVHSDFMSYISSGKTTEVKKQYKGFSAVFIKESSKEYRLDIRD